MTYARPPCSITIRSKPDYWITTSGDVIVKSTGTNVPIAGIGYCDKCHANVPYVDIGFEEVSIPELLMESFYGPLDRQIFTMKPGYWFDLDYLVYDAMERLFNIDGSNPSADIELHSSMYFPEFAVSSVGFALNLINHRPVHVHESKYGYLQVITHDGKDVPLHRIVYAAWNGDLIDNLQIDHLDHNRANPAASNLEQVTALENSRRKYSSGNSRSLFQITADEEKYIVRHLSSGEKLPYIAASMGYMYNVEFKNATQKALRNFKNSEIYDKSKRLPNYKSHYTYGDTEKICEMMQSGYCGSEIADILNVKFDKAFRDHLSLLKRNRRFPEITSKYDFSNFKVTPSQWSDNERHKLCQMMRDRFSHADICKYFSNKDHYDLYIYARRITEGKIGGIGAQYDLIGKTYSAKHGVVN